MLRGQLNQIHISELHNRLLIAVEHWIAAQSIPVAACEYTVHTVKDMSCCKHAMQHEALLLHKAGHARNVRTQMPLTWHVCFAHACSQCTQQ